MGRSSALAAGLAVFCMSAPATAAPLVRLAEVNTQDSFNSRLLRAADFCIGWVQRKQEWSGANIEMEDLHGPPTSEEPGDLWDMNHSYDITIAALGPEERGCAVNYMTSSWDKNIALKLLGDRLTRELGFAFVYDEDVVNAKKVTLQQPGSNTVAKVTVFTQRPGEDEPYFGMDGTIFFSE